MWVWYAGVKMRTGLSDDALDKRFLNTGNRRPRHFNRIKHLGHAPRPGNSKNSRWLIDLVDSDPEFHGTARLFDTPFWQLVGPKYLDLDATRTLLFPLTKALGLYRVNETQAHVARRFQVKDPAFDFPADRIKQDLTRTLSDRAKIDDLAILGLLFREALLTCELEQAIHYRKAVVKAAKKFECSICLDGAGRTTFWLLINRRLLRNQLHIPVYNANEEYSDWRLGMFNTTSWDTAAKSFSTPDIFKKRQWLAWLSFQEDPDDIGHAYVKMSPTLQYFLQNYDVLNAEHLRQCKLEATEYLIRLNIADKSARHEARLRAGKPDPKLAKIRRRLKAREIRY